MSFKRTLLLVSSACASALVAGSALAQTAAEPQRLEEIVVTARKRAESLQDVPVAVSAISAADLQSRNVTDLAKLAELAPQVMIGRQTNGTGAILTIRGISSSSADAGLDQSVVVNIDGVQVSRGRIINAALFDVGQVEVLAGPQSLFFGKNSPAGVISITSQDPTNEFEGYVKAGYEFEAHERYIDGAVSGPLTDTLKGRLAFHVADMRGYLKNIARPVVYGANTSGVILPGATHGKWGPEAKDYTARLGLVWTPTEDFTAKLKITAGKQKLNSMSGFVENYCVGTNQATLLGRPLPLSDCKKDKVKAESAQAPLYATNFPFNNDGVPYAKTDLLFASLVLDKKVGDNINLVSTTGYYRQAYQGANTADFSEWAAIWSSQRETYRLLTQELRAETSFDGPLNVMLGGYFEHSGRAWFNAADLFHGGLNPATGDWTSFQTTLHGETDSYSLFGQASWDITPELELSAGARYSHDKKDMILENIANGITGTALRARGVPLRSVYKGDNVSPEVTLTWHPKSGQTLYGAYKTGYKSGGVSNAGILGPAATSESLKFGPEKSRGFEVGYKAELLDRTLRFDVAAYRYNYLGLQLATFNSQTISYTINNAAKARTQGVQGSFKWLATNDLSFNGNIGYNEAKYRTFIAPCYAGQTVATGCVNVGGANGQDLSGKALVRAPKLTATLGGDYDARLGGDLVAKLSLSGTYTSSYQTQGDNAPGAIQKAYWLLNAAVRVGPESGKYELALIGRNLTDSYYLISSVGAPGRSAQEFTGIFNRPREVVLQGTVRF